ncbi:patatin-like phospholipase family protein [uncultured Kordia sp.]|uniref:patatin-like phospholipase family protein n=1 Tax=uncultured Kordia sp. TaxID=507699 RepID=UPI002626D3BD|nr:patatin-like phospholipase family protein [uncultured Kordia sp.]
MTDKKYIIMKIGLALSGGGSKGVAHIGAIKALEEYGIVSTHIAGSSAGAIVGALYAYGYSWETMLRFFKSVKLLNFTKFALGKPGFLDAEKYYSEFKTYFRKDNFEGLQKELTITATDVLNGKLTIFQEGELIKPILASAAFPGVFTPVQVGNHYYIDGGVLDNFPVTYLTETCDVIIGIHVSGYDVLEIKDLKSTYGVVERAFMFKSVQEDYAKFKHCDIAIAPQELNKYGTFDRGNLDKIFKIGYDATKEILTKSELVQAKFQK